MLCPQCKTGLALSHTKEYTDPDSGTKVTNFFYTCTDWRCANYLKILNGSEAGEAAQITDKMPDRTEKTGEPTE